MPPETTVFSEEGVRDMRGFRLWVRMGGVDRRMSESERVTRWNALPHGVREFWCDKAQTPRASERSA